MRSGRSSTFRFLTRKTSQSIFGCGLPGFAEGRVRIALFEDFPSSLLSHSCLAGRGKKGLFADILMGLPCATGLAHCQRHGPALRCARAMMPTQLQRALTATDCGVAFDNLTKQLYATDASIYQIEPMGVAFPRSAGQAGAVIRAAVEANTAVLAGRASKKK